MKKAFLLIACALFTFTMIACSDAVSDSSSTTTTTNNTTTNNTTSNNTTSTTITVTTTSTSKDSATALTDTDNNAIYSGSATISFIYGSQSASKTINAEYIIDGVDVEISSGSYSTATGNEDGVVFLVINGGSLKIEGTSEDPIEITKSGTAASGGQVGDDYNFYAINSGIVVVGTDSTADLDYVTISTTGNGSNAVVATGYGEITIDDSTITTSGSAGSRGLHCTYDGEITADSVSITTQGASCATLATDRGGGTIVASNMTLETNSAGSPLVYSTDSITVSSSSGSANAAQMVVVEGGSSATLTGCNFSCTGDGNRTGTSDSNSSSHTIDAGGIFIYQSVSGDSEDGTDYFTATNCTLTVTTSGVPMIYLTNIEAEITLSGNTMVQQSSSDYFIMCEATNQWGTTGSNGADVTLDVTGQNLANLTSIKAYVGSTSTLTGATGFTITN